MKKVLSLLFAVIITTGIFSGCQQSATDTGNSEASTSSKTEISQNEQTSTKASESTASSENSETDAGDTVTIKTAGSEINAADLTYKTDSADAPIVYYSSDISAEGLLDLYKALGRTPSGKVAVKVSTGESENTNYLRPELIKDLVQELDGTVVECMTAYGGVRSQPESHHKIAEEHGFTAIAPFDLMDEEGEKEIPFEGGERLTKAVIGTHTDDYEDFLMLSHFKGHAMAGYGGALKNVSIGISSVSGKIYIHSGGERTEGSITGGEQDAFLESLAEATKAISDHIGTEHMIYISVMNRLSVDCDCDANPAEPDMHDIGILASTDPVALDQACIDFVYTAPDSGSLKERIESRNGIHALEHAEKIGLGKRSYQLKVI